MLRITILVMILVCVCEIVYGSSNDLLLFENHSDIELTKVNVKYNAQQKILVLESVLNIPNLWHVYAHQLKQKYYTEIGFHLQDTTLGRLVHSKFPHAEVFETMGEKIRVYSGSLSFIQWFYLVSSKPFPIKIQLQYQACNDKMCLPPAWIPILIKKKGVDDKFQLTAEW